VPNLRQKVWKEEEEERRSKMSDVNKVFVLGNLGRDPDLKFTDGGKAVARLSVATTRRWTNRESGETVEETEWHRVSVWGKQAEMCDKFLSKGNKVHVEGRLRTSSWDDKETGKKKYSTEIVAENISFLTTDRQSDSASPSRQSPPPQRQPKQKVAEDIDDDDIPF
jgi:single-strand DNA-binding protein